jgi:hypothetical protein
MPSKDRLSISMLYLIVLGRLRLGFRKRRTQFASRSAVNIPDWKRYSEEYVR